MNSTLESLNYTTDLPLKFPVGYRVVATFSHVIIFIVGFCGNIATIHVVRKTKTMHTPTYCYLVSLAIADLLTIISAIPEAIISPYLYLGQWIMGQAACSISVFINFLGINVSSTSICCFTIERYIGICHPFLAVKVCSVSRAKKIIVGIWLFAFLYCSHWLGLTVIKTHHYPGFPVLESCGFRLPREHYVYFFLADIYLFYIIPLLIAVVLYTRIGFVLKSNVANRHIRKNIRAGPTLLTPSGTAAAPPQRDSSVLQVVRMLVVVVISFAVLWLPYRGLLVYNSFASKKYLNIWYLLFAKTFIYINSAINPILYNILSKRFRHAFLVHILPFLYHKCMTTENQSWSTEVSRYSASKTPISRTASFNPQRRIISSAHRCSAQEDETRNPRTCQTATIPSNPREWREKIVLI